MFFKKGVPAGYVYEGKRDIESVEDYLLNQLYDVYSRVLNYFLRLFFRLEK